MTAFLLLALLTPAVSQAQEPLLPPVRIPRLAAVAPGLSGFVPPGWRVDTRAEGDLNHDGRPDLAFVLRTQQPVLATTPYGMGAGRPFDSTPRILAIAFAAPGGGYRLALQNHVLIPRPEDTTAAGWMFEEGSLGIERGALVVRLAFLYSSAGGSSFRFRWQDGAFRLIGYDFSDVHRYSHCTNTVSINYLTGRMRTTFQAREGAAERVRWRNVSRSPLLALDAIGDGVTFDPHGAIARIRC